MDQTTGLFEVSGSEVDTGDRNQAEEVLLDYSVILKENKMKQNKNPAHLLMFMSKKIGALEETQCLARLLIQRFQNASSQKFLLFARTKEKKEYSTNQKRKGLLSVGLLSIVNIDLQTPSFWFTNRLSISYDPLQLTKNRLSVSFLMERSST